MDVILLYLSCTRVFCSALLCLQLIDLRSELHLSAVLCTSYVSLLFFAASLMLFHLLLHHTLSWINLKTLPSYYLPSHTKCCFLFLRYMQGENMYKIKQQWFSTMIYDATHLSGIFLKVLVLPLCVLSDQRACVCSVCVSVRAQVATAWLKGTKRFSGSLWWQIQYTQHRFY